MNAERGWIVEPQPLGYGVEGWAARHRDMGHHPHPAPTDENPERWDCDCGGVNRILTVEQIAKKFAHLGAAAKARREGRRLPEDDPAWQERIRQAKQRVAEWEEEDGALALAVTLTHTRTPPCPQCGYATRYKQFGPMRCACPEPRPRRVICSLTLTEHCPYEGEEDKGSG